MTDNITLKSIKASLHRERKRVGPGPNHGNDIGEDEHLDEWVTQDNKNMPGSIGVIELHSSALVSPKPSLESHHCVTNGRR